MIRFYIDVVPNQAPVKFVIPNPLKTRTTAQRAVAEVAEKAAAEKVAVEAQNEMLGAQ